MDQPAAHGPGRGTDFLLALYAQQGAAVLRYVLRLVHGDYQRAEDITQETFLRAWQHRDSLDRERATPWLYTVAHNLVVSSYRKEKARPPETPLGDTDPAGQGEEDLDRMLESWQMAEALGGLRPDHRAALIQVYYLRRTVAEAAAQLGVPEGTVKSRCHYGLRALRNVLEERGVTSR